MGREARELPAARPLSAPKLLDHLPQLLERLAHTAGGEGGGLGEFPEIHALERLGEGFDLSGVAREYALLRDCILRLYGEECRAQGLAPVAPLEELRRLNAALDEAVNISVSRYARARERTLVALDRISEAALESDDAERFLPRLLQVLLETTESVDTALLLLREGDLLRTRAAIGLEGVVASGFTLKVGEGFAGLIAQDARPRELHSAASDPLVKSELLRERGVKGLYGVPLVEAEQVIGVAVMGSRSAHTFSQTDRMLFRTTVQRATMLLVQAHLRDRERTLRARAEESLAQTEALLAAAPAGVAFWDPQLRYLRVNEALARAHGLPAEAHAGRTLAELMSPRGRGRASRACWRRCARAASGARWSSARPAPRTRRARRRAPGWASTSRCAPPRGACWAWARWCRTSPSARRRSRSCGAGTRCSPTPPPGR